jgi:hypothetical protein
MQMYDDILGPVSNNHNKTSLLFLDSIANERGDARITVYWSISCRSQTRTMLDIHCLANHDSSTEYKLNFPSKATCAQFSCDSNTLKFDFNSLEAKSF